MGVAGKEGSCTGNGKAGIPESGCSLQDRSTALKLALTPMLFVHFMDGKQRAARTSCCFQGLIESLESEVSTAFTEAQA